jgi:hypothetical protein
MLSTSEGRWACCEDPVLVGVSEPGGSGGVAGSDNVSYSFSIIENKMKNFCHLAFKQSKISQ